MRLRTEALLIFAAVWCIAVGILTGRVDGLNLLGFYPLLLRKMREELREWNSN